MMKMIAKEIIDELKKEFPGFSKEFDILLPMTEELIKADDRMPIIEEMYKNTDVRISFAFGAILGRLMSYGQNRNI